MPGKWKKVLVGEGDFRRKIFRFPEGVLTIIEENVRTFLNVLRLLPKKKKSCGNCENSRKKTKVIKNYSGNC